LSSFQDAEPRGNRKAKTGLCTLQRQAGVYVYRSGTSRGALKKDVLITTNVLVKLLQTSFMKR